MLGDLGEKRRTFPFIKEFKQSVEIFILVSHIGANQAV